MTALRNKDWRNEINGVGAQMWFMCEEKMFTDLYINVMNMQQTKTFSCHRVFLSRLSPVFEKMITESEISEGSYYITISPLDPKLFHQVLRYAYTEYVEFNSVGQALAVRNFCSKYNIVQLRHICETHISRHINSDNIWDVLDEPMKPAHLATKWGKYLIRNTDACLRRERFLSCMQTTLLAMLKQPHLEVIDELQVVLAVVRWARFQNHGRPLDPFICRQLLGPCLQHIRFLALTPTQFSEHVAKSGLLSIEDCLVVLVNLNSPGQMPLPLHLCRDTSKRSDGNSAPEQPPPPPMPMQRQVSFESAKPMAKPAAEANKAAEKMYKEPKKEEVKKDVKIEEKPKPSPAPKCQKISEMNFERLHVSQEFRNTSFNSNELNFVRSTQPSTDNYSGVIAAPFSMQIQFSVNHSVKLTALKLMRQFNANLPLQQLYTEEVQVEVLTVPACTVISKATFGPQQIEFGPGNFEVKFSKQCVLFTNKPYTLNIVLLSSGQYLNPCRSMNSHCEGISTSFSGVAHGKGLLHSIVCKRAP